MSSNIYECAICKTTEASMYDKPEDRRPPPRWITVPVDMWETRTELTQSGVREIPKFVCRQCKEVIRRIIS